FLMGAAFFPAFPLPDATRGFCARALAFVGGFGSSGTGAGTFVSAMLSVLILSRSPLAAAAAIRIFIALVRDTGKAIGRDCSGILSRAKNRALESPGRADLQWADPGAHLLQRLLFGRMGVIPEARRPEWRIHEAAS